MEFSVIMPQYAAVNFALRKKDLLKALLRSSPVGMF
jgi:hypothetical protein